METSNPSKSTGSNYDFDYPPLNSSGSPDGRPLQSVRPKHTTVNFQQKGKKQISPLKDNSKKDELVHKSIQIEKKNLVRYTDNFFDYLKAEASKMEGSLELRKTQNGSLNITVKANSSILKDVFEMVTRETRQRFQKKLLIDSFILDYLKKNNNRKLKELMIQYQFHVKFVVEDDGVLLYGPENDLEKVISILMEDIRAKSESETQYLKNIDKKFHPLIRGPFDKNIQKMIEEHNKLVKIKFPSSSNNENTIAVVGHGNARKVVIEKIMSIYNKIESFDEAKIPMKKEFYKNLTRANGIDKILFETGVAVTLPSDPDSNCIILVGNNSDLTDAIKIIIDRAKTYEIGTVSCPNWVFGLISSYPEFTFNSMKILYPKIWLSYDSSSSTIMLDGPSDAVKAVSIIYMDEIEKIESKMKMLEFPVSQHLYSYLKEEGNEIIDKISSNTGTQLSFLPKNASLSTDDDMFTISLFGESQGVEDAYQMLIEFSEKMNIIETRVLDIPSLLIPKMLQISGFQSIHDFVKSSLDTNIRVNVRTLSNFSTSVVLSDKKILVCQAEKLIFDLVSKAEEMVCIHTINVPQAYHYILIGKNGQIRDSIIKESGIDKLIFPRKDDTSYLSTNIIIVGCKASVESAKNIIFEKCNTQVKLDQVEISLPKSLCEKLQTGNGQIMKRLVRKFCSSKPFGQNATEKDYNVTVIFPQTLSANNTVKIHGAEDCVKKVSEELSKLSDGKKLLLDTVMCDSNFVRFLIGKNGIQLKKLIGDYHVEVIVFNQNTTASKSSNQPTIKETPVYLISLSPADISKVKLNVIKFLKEIEDIREIEVEVPRKHSKKLLSRHKENQSLLSEMISNYPNVRAVLPRNNTTESVTLKGPSKAVTSLKKDISNLLNKWDKVILKELIINNDHMNFLSFKTSSILTTLQNDFDVEIKVVVVNNNEEINSTSSLVASGENAIEKDHFQQEEGVSNTVESKAPISSKQTLESQNSGPIKVSTTNFTKKFKLFIEGEPQNISKTIEAIMSYQPYRTTHDIDKQYHGTLIGQGGIGLKKISEGVNVQIKFPSSNVKSNAVEIFGSKSNVETVISRLEKEVKILKDKQKDWEKTNCIIEVPIMSKWLPRIIGKGGQQLHKYRQQWNVNITIQRVNYGRNNSGNDEDGDRRENQTKNPSEQTVILKGDKDLCAKAKEKLESLIRVWENTTKTEIIIPREIHGMIRGPKGTLVHQIQKKHRVEILFPSIKDKTNDHVTIKGLKDDVEACCAELTELAQRMKLEFEEQERLKTDFEGLTLDQFRFTKVEDFSNQVGLSNVAIESKNEPKSDGDNKNTIESSGALIVGGVSSPLSTPKVEKADDLFENTVENRNSNGFEFEGDSLPIQGENIAYQCVEDNIVESFGLIDNNEDVINHIDTSTSFSKDHQNGDIEFGLSNNEEDGKEESFASKENGEEFPENHNNQ